MQIKHHYLHFTKEASENMFNEIICPKFLSELKAEVHNLRCIRNLVSHKSWDLFPLSAQIILAHDYNTCIYYLPII